MYGLPVTASAQYRVADIAAFGIQNDRNFGTFRAQVCQRHRQILFGILSFIARHLRFIAADIIAGSIDDRLVEFKNRILDLPDTCRQFRQIGVKSHADQ